MLQVLLLATMPEAHAAHEPIAAIGSSPTTSREDELVWFARSVDAVPELTKKVETQFADGKILDVSFDGQGAVPIFNMKGSRRGQIWNIVVDASKREIIRVDPLMPRSDLGAEDQRKVADFEQSNIVLSETMEIAEQYGVGKAVSAGLEYAQGRLVFLVVIVSDGALKEVSVDPGRVVKGRRRSSARSFEGRLQ
ncbi:PepSY domain-containing protein [Rhodopseudomonas sp. P2A-2r]|uniref:PepSY domain-containing protein n=1 Tax=unclassified Rhodopseudomonas TaxID=2638247 RepID=UPI002234D5BD|nr:hypothetical protein [Rhodopseudomonas sp. P2A-2r]UZE50186.1 hypothetical protein ONR75_05410 [Rhodopseudomonas sp. P2A-2r]